MASQIGTTIAKLNWNSIHQTLDDQGFIKLPPLLDSKQCQAIIDMYDIDSYYRSRIDMARYRFGEGEYKYFQAPLPPLIQELRKNFYPELAKAANRWLELLGKEAIYPDTLAEFLKQCHEKEQVRSTPLILKYETGGYNCLHQDLYGEVYFPFQVLFALNQRNQDYTGGESILVEQRPRAQSRGHVITLDQGEALIFPTNHRPIEGKLRFYRNTVRHGVSSLRSGIRYGLGIIFHDAK
ncbi:2OG-Fe(II) oxygenase [Rossellomorea sp. BNER]|jgi:uncharacterized protein|uniref:2OG-Fe(II) oxygenase n=1 Tax=Rossellomorea sp. BNER TaxID=2962031 RepID=UPI003AF21F7F|nr:2OG-Fe(II) oxygenase [Rossellomorea sp. BNER]